VLKISSNLRKGKLEEKWQFKTKYFANKKAFASFCSDFPEEMNQEFILQEFISGAYLGLGVAYQNNQLISAFQWQALREYEPGLGALRISQNLDQGLLKKAEVLCKAFNYDGVCEVEFRGHLNDPKNITLMEINPRLWGGVSLPYYCGIDFPHLAYQIYDGAKVSPQREYAVGVYSRNFLGDLKLLQKVLLSKGVGENNPNCQFSRVQVIKDFLFSLGRAQVHDLESLDDPRVFLMHYWNKIRRMLFRT
jgi:predicted ATP-grasp superfamily ATP-dependent carboligase